MDGVLARQLERLTYAAPLSVLEQIGPSFFAIARGEPMKGTDRKKCVESFVVAALARCFMLFSGTDEKLTVNIEELRDADGHIRREKSDRVQFMPVQVKELAAGTDAADPYEEFAKLYRYSGAELCIAYWINRDVRIDVAKLPSGEWRFGQLWILGSEADDCVNLTGGPVRMLQSGHFLDCRLSGSKGAVQSRRFIPAV